jgi:hypothetical protein
MFLSEIPADFMSFVNSRTKSLRVREHLARIRIAASFCLMVGFEPGKQSKTEGLQPGPGSDD